MTRAKWVWSISFALVVTVFFAVVPAILQDQKYHLFADARTIAGIPNFWNVVSNLPFAIVGTLGLIKFRGLTDRVLFVGVLLTAFGSAYYHLAPADSRLIWDRLPMTVIFMSFVASVVSTANAEQKKPEPSPWALAVLLALGTGSVLWWRVTGDLRPERCFGLGQYETTFRESNIDEKCPAEPDGRGPERPRHRDYWAPPEATGHPMNDQELNQLHSAASAIAAFQLSQFCFSELGTERDRAKA